MAAGAAAVAIEADKYILFGLAGETYALSLLDLEEIVASFAITVLPNLPAHFHGVMALRDRVIPVLDLRSRFELPAAERTRSTRVIVVDLAPSPIGIWVDEVLRVATIARDEIRTAPELTGGRRVPYVVGVSRHAGDKLVIHLDIKKVLTSLEQIRLAEITASVQDALLAQGREEGDGTETPEDGAADDERGSEAAGSSSGAGGQSAPAEAAAEQALCHEHSDELSR